MGITWMGSSYLVHSWLIGFSQKLVDIGPERVPLFSLSLRKLDQRHLRRRGCRRGRVFSPVLHRTLDGIAVLGLLVSNSLDQSRKSAASRVECLYPQLGSGGFIGRRVVSLATAGPTRPTRGVVSIGGRSVSTRSAARRRNGRSASNTALGSSHRLNHGRSWDSYSRLGEVLELADGLVDRHSYLMFAASHFVHASKRCDRTFRLFWQS